MRVNFVQKGKTNWLLRCLISVSLAIHLILFMHISGIYYSKALSFIEFTMEDISKPSSRDIPRPKLKPKTYENPPEVKRLNIRNRIVPTFNAMKLENVEKDIQDGLVEQINPSSIFNISDLGGVVWGPQAEIGTSYYVTRNDYFEMVRLRIESQKDYPEMARIKYIEGHTTVGFIITRSGIVTELTIIKSSRTKALDEAAISAVRKASPFPSPPSALFKGLIPMELTIVFEIT
ncbi:MAG: TonB family protein [Thermodesulfobacteriota bacterium]|nr:TonB family protein [Thermodesulfobacteriota bacterium]